MSVAHFGSTAMTRGSSRWLLLGSLALNLFFVGVAVAMAIRSPAATAWDRDVFVRVSRLSATLPKVDGDLVLDQMKAHRAAIADAQDRYFAARERIHETLRHDPFKVDDMRAAMAQTRAARQNYDTVIQGVFAGIAEKMSPAGRRALADWRATRKPNNDRQ
ncbi:MAG TPA: periplasmic heavy metal sensor [Pseudolabrys sp.]|jgi:uncharacterized membrane protein|nr:periplasmic heavy metal sensor [Pseudolabrys sp.]